MDSLPNNNEMHNANSMLNNKQITPIICPNCGSKNLSFVETYRKNVILRIVIAVMVFIICFLIFTELSTIISYIVAQYRGEKSNKEFNGITLGFIILLFVLQAFFRLIILAEESKSHAKGICRDCGHIWLLD